MLMEAAAGVMQPDGTAYLNGQTVVQHLFSQAVADNIAVVRAFGHGATGNFVLQPSPGMPATASPAPLDCFVIFTFAPAERNLQVSTMRRRSKPWIRS